MLIDREMLAARLKELKEDAYSNFQNPPDQKDYDDMWIWLMDSGWNPRWIALADALDVVMSESYEVTNSP